VTDGNLATLWNWSVAESGAGAVMRWNNPLNTTQPGFGGVDQNSVGVKAYPDVAAGVAATVRVLQNGFYPSILANLRGSVPSASWQNACHDLGTWGTGCGWLGLAAGVPAQAVAAGASASERALAPVGAFFASANALSKPSNWWRLLFFVLGGAMVTYGAIRYFR
jgi:hypothetical protein